MDPTRLQVSLKFVHLHCLRNVPSAFAMGAGALAARPKPIVALSVVPAVEGLI